MMMTTHDRAGPATGDGSGSAPDRGDNSRPARHGNRGQRPARGPRFDPARLWLGLCLLAIAAAFIARTTGQLDVPLRYLAAALPVALVATAGVAIGSYLFRRRCRS